MCGRMVPAHLVWAGRERVTESLLCTVLHWYYH